MGRERLIDTGSASSSSSAAATSMGPLYPPSIGRKGGAPMAICRDRAPMILAFSNRVSFGGPILTSKLAREGGLDFFCDF